jgi:CheY-like chemotaxis protein
MNGQDDHRGMPAIRPAELADGNAASATLRGATVLVVDDDALALEVLRELLIGFGASVVAASSAGEAIALVQKCRPDVIVSDIRMPERDGFQLIKVVRTLSSKDGGCTPAIALSGFGRREDRVRALLSGYQVHLTKPIQAQHLVATIARLIGRATS